jgi:iron complex transport system substrate-binding protein
MIKRFIFLLVISMVWACGGQVKEEQAAISQLKMITAGGTVSEIVAALGFEANIIATDITSTYPASLKELPSIGYRNQIKAEGILAFGAEVVLAEEGYLSADVISQLQSSGISVKLFSKPNSIKGTYKLIAEIAEFLNVALTGDLIISSLKADEAALEIFLQENPMETPPKVAFIMARGLETVFLAGEETFAHEIIHMAGGEPAGQGFKDFIPLTPEAMVSLNPDYLLFFDSGLSTIGGRDGISQLKGVDQTTAFHKKQFLSYDGLYLSGFGPRVAKATLDLAKGIRSN